MEKKTDFFVLPGRRRGINISIGPDESVHVEGAMSASFRIPVINNGNGNPYLNLFAKPVAEISVVLHVRRTGEIDISIGIGEVNELKQKIRELPGISVVPKKNGEAPVFEIIAHDGDFSGNNGFLIETLPFSA